MLLPLISLSAIFLPAISLPTISLLTISHPAISLPRYFTPPLFHFPLFHTPLFHFPLFHFPLFHFPLFHFPLFHSRYFTTRYFTPPYFPPRYFPPRYFTPRYFTPRYFSSRYFTPRYFSSNHFPQSFPHLLIPYRHGLSCHLFFNLFFFSPFTFIFSSLVIFFRATSLSAILLSSSHKIPFSYSHLHFPSHKTALNIFPLPNPSEIPSPIFILLPAIHTAPAITAKRASQYINADPSPIFHQQIFPSAPGY